MRVGELDKKPTVRLDILGEASPGKRKVIPHQVIDREARNERESVRQPEDLGSAIGYLAKSV